MQYAEAYCTAAENLEAISTFPRGNYFYMGPVLQTLGLATELTLKALLFGGGKTEKEIKSFGHSTYSSYFAARKFFDELAFLDFVGVCSATLSTPENALIAARLNGEQNIDARWKCYFEQLRILDSTYNRPFRTRYISTGEIFLPEAKIVLFGTRILIQAMQERMTDCG